MKRALALLALLLAGDAAAATALDLDAARERATERALAVALARWDLEASRGAAARWVGAALPDVAGFVDASTGAGWTAFGFERPVSSQFGVGATARVVLLNPAGWAAAASARRTVAGREATVSWAEALARQDATELFAQVVAEQRVAEALALAHQAAEEDARATEALVGAGLRQPADSARTTAAALDLSARALEAQGRATAACASLQNLLADEIDGSCRLSLPGEPEPADAPGEHPALVAARAALDAAESAHGAAVAGSLPTVSGDGAVGYYGVPGGGGGPGWNVGLSVDVPLRFLAEGRGEIQEARAGRERAKDQLSGQRRALEAARLGAEAEWEAARAARAARQGGLEAARAAERLVQERYRTGLSDVSALLDARRARVDAEISLLRAEARLWTASAAVEAARGVR